MPTSAGADFGPDVPPPTEDLAAIIGRAGQMGVVGWRVALALGVPPLELATIEALIAQERLDMLAVPPR